MSFSKAMLHLLQLALVSTGSVRPSNLPQILTPPSHSTLIDAYFPEAGNITIANNASLLANHPEYSFVNGTAKLPGKACLMVALEALVQLSFKGFSEPYTRGSFLSDDYPEVLIRITTYESPRPEIFFPTSFAIKCIILLITKMMQESEYRNSTITTHWIWGEDSVPLGQVAFFAREGATIQKPPALARKMESLLQRPNLANFTKMDIGTDIVSAQNDDDDKLLVFAEFVGGTITIADVFLNVYESVAYMACFPTTDPMAPFRIRNLDTNAQLSYMLIDPPDPPPRPSFVFQYGWGARSLQTLPQYMFEQGKFNEIKFISGWDKTLFGVGHLVKSNTRPGPRVELQSA